ncbi:MAG: hypothetical protein K9M07_05010 [Simkaniaceae bacterium]|nr:hypothetical protein [Simkaniaceae bacterium]MCF7852581.1 hypothetical protein [Simkaniaceae bacterium]
MDIDRKQILESCLETIEGIADKEYQKKIWIRGEGPEVDDFNETTCNFFQDGNGIIQNYKDFSLTHEQYQILRKFRDAFESFCSKYEVDNESMLNHPEWTKITEIANEVLKVFDYYKDHK